VQERTRRGRGITARGGGGSGDDDPGVAATADGASETTRLEAFSDGVFAIAITLLIIEIKVPPEGTVAPGGLPAALRHLWPSYLGFAMSFATIGIMWANHHNIFKLVRHVDPAFIALNTLFLMCVSFIPFPTGVLAEYVRVPSEQTTAALFYGGTLTGTAVVYCSLWLYASRGGRLLGAEADPRKVRTITARFLPGPFLYLAATLLSLWSVRASLVVHASLALLYVLPDFLPSRTRATQTTRTAD
jgi:uncharacterized membrane protein